MSFENLTPDNVFMAVEKTMGLRLTNLIRSLPSYINRVYELKTADGAGLIAKFYRPGRWSRECLLDEHRFVLDCAEAELPVVAPHRFDNGETLAETDGILFSLYPKRAGRPFDVAGDMDWLRLGSLIGRLHNCGALRPAPARVTIGPRRSALDDIEHLCANVVPPQSRDRYRATAMRLVELAAPLFENLEAIRIHGDCHRGNILDRLDEGLLLIDFDDMAMGPPVQDLWLLLPERAAGAKREIELFLEGYERFRRFDRRTIRCIESLRAMRMIYFLGWASRQAGDYQFKSHFPDWGSDKFWQKEINDLREQMGFVEEEVE